MDKKYEFTGKTKKRGRRILHRIRAVKSFGFVQKGTIGGWIEAECNLSHCGGAWIGDNAVVYGNAEIRGNALIRDNAVVCGNARVSDNAFVYGNAKVCGNAVVCGNANVYRNAKVYGEAQVFRNALVFGNAAVCGNAKVSGDAAVYDSAKVSGCAIVCDNVEIFDGAVVYGDAEVSGNAMVCGDAVVCRNSDYVVFKNCWSSMRWFTYTRSNHKWKVGCFHGTGDELIKKAYADSETSGRCYEAIVNAMNAIENERKSIPDDSDFDLTPLAKEGQST